MKPINTQNVNLYKTIGDKSQLKSILPLPQFAFVGRSNVGKSSLLNTLINRKSLARVSSSPGKTITINYYNIDEKIFLVDLPGYGYAKRSQSDKSKWSSLVDGYFTENTSIDLLKLVLQLVDSRTGITSDDETMLSWLNSSQIPYIVLATKVDKLSKTERESNLSQLSAHSLLPPSTTIIPFSSSSNEGKKEVWESILKILS